MRTRDQADYQKALEAANAAISGVVSRVGQIYERLYFLFQDGDAGQPPWSDLQNPFEDWPTWHLDAAQVGFNQDRQAQAQDWRGNDATAPADGAIYVLPVSDKASARQAIYNVALQGEGPLEAQVEGMTHFDKFLPIYREFRIYKTVAAAPPMARNQAQNPSTIAGSPGCITDPSTLAWANLANTRYEMLLLDIALALSIGIAGGLPGTMAMGRDFLNWSFREMLISIKNWVNNYALCPFGLERLNRWRA